MRGAPKGERVTGAAARIEGAKRKRRTLLADTRGSVMAEAVILLPVLVLVWTVIVYIHYSFRDAQRNMATLRDHAWSHGFGGCNTTAPAPTQINEREGYDGESSGGMSVSGILMFLVGEGFRIEQFNGLREIAVRRPNALGGGINELNWQVRMLCNEDQPGNEDVPWYQMLGELNFF